MLLILIAQTITAWYSFCWHRFLIAPTITGWYSFCWHRFVKMLVIHLHNKSKQTCVYSCNVFCPAYCKPSWGHILYCCIFCSLLMVFFFLCVWCLHPVVSTVPFLPCNCNSTVVFLLVTKWRISVEESLSKTLNPYLLPVSRLVPCMVASAISVWMCVGEWVNIMFYLCKTPCIKGAI